MDQTPYDDRIAALRVEIERQRSEMETVAQAFIKAAIAPVQAWYSSHIETSVKKDPNQLAELTGEQVKLLKAAREELVRNAGDVVRNNLDQNSCWTHRRPVTLAKRRNEPYVYEQIYESSGPKTPSDFQDEAFRKIMGETGPLLKQYGFSVSDYKDSYPIGSMKYTSGLFRASSEMTSIMFQYNSISKGLHQSHEDLHQAEQDKIQYLANQNWDSN